MTDLEQATAEELLDELSKRFECVVFAGERPALDASGEQKICLYRGGGLSGPTGLVEILKAEARKWVK